MKLSGKNQQEKISEKFLPEYLSSENKRVSYYISLRKENKTDNYLLYSA